MRAPGEVWLLEGGAITFAVEGTSRACNVRDFRFIVEADGSFSTTPFKQLQRCPLLLVCSHLSIPLFYAAKTNIVYLKVN